MVEFRESEPLWDDAPCMYRRVHIAEVPLVRRDLAVWLHVPLPSEQVQLLLREFRINDGEGYAMESGVPCSEEWILPPT